MLLYLWFWKRRPCAQVDVLELAFRNRGSRNSIEITTRWTPLLFLDSFFVASVVRCPCHCLTLFMLGRDFTFPILPVFSLYFCDFKRTLSNCFVFVHLIDILFVNYFYARGPTSSQDLYIYPIPNHKKSLWIFVPTPPPKYPWIHLSQGCCCCFRSTATAFLLKLVLAVRSNNNAFSQSTHNEAQSPLVPKKLTANALPRTLHNSKRSFVWIINHN